MGKTSYKGLRIDYRPGQKVKVMLGRDWFDAEVVKANKKTVIVNTLFSKTKYRSVPVVEKKVENGGIAEDLIRDVSKALPQAKSVLEPYTISGTKIVKLPRIRVKPIEDDPLAGAGKTVAATTAPEPVLMPEPSPTPAPQETVVEASVPEPDELTMAIDQAEAMLEEPSPDKVAEAVNERRAEQGITEELEKAGVKPETAADVLAELEKMLE